MIYREIGKTGMSASAIGLGCEHLDNRPYGQVEEVIHSALECGVNILDVFMPGTPVRENIARALGSRRKDVLIQGHIGSVDLREQYDVTRDVPTCQKYFDNLLRSFNDYIDFGMMFFIDTEEDYREVFESDYITYVQKLKQEGKIRAIGASSHNPQTAARIMESGVIDLLMFSVNPAYDMLPLNTYIISVLENGLDADALQGIEPARARLYKLCENRRVAITTMKTLGAGKLISPDFSPFGEPLTVPQCIHYALTRPAVVSALIGCKSREEVLEAVRYLDLTDAERDFSQVIGSRKGTLAAQCMYCNHCQPCPAEIDIAAVTRLLDAAEIGGTIPPHMREQYDALAHKASECILCGSCEARCPFGVGVIENMRRTQAAFEK